VVIGGLAELTPELIDRLDEEAYLAGYSDPRDWRLDEAEEESFPASDPHSDWAGPGR
jgi:hypothetical protein